MKEAIRKIRREMSENENNKYFQIVGAHLIEFLKENNSQENIDKIMTDDKSIKKSLTEMKKKAKESAVDSVGVLTDDEGFKIVRDYYGLTVCTTGANLGFDLDSFI